MRPEGQLAIASEAASKTFWNFAWARASPKPSRKFLERAWGENFHSRLGNLFRKTLQNQIASELRTPPVLALPAARTADRAIGLAETQGDRVPQRRSRAPFLLRNALRAPS